MTALATKLLLTSMKGLDMLSLVMTWIGAVTGLLILGVMAVSGLVSGDSSAGGIN